MKANFPIGLCGIAIALASTLDKDFSLKTATPSYIGGITVGAALFMSTNKK